MPLLVSCRRGTQQKANDQPLAAHLTRKCMRQSLKSMIRDCDQSASVDKLSRMTDE
jgi:hypothetical protein